MPQFFPPSQLAAPVRAVGDQPTYPSTGVYGQLEVVGATDAAYRLSLGFNTDINYLAGVIQALVNASGFRALHLNPRGGNVGIGLGLTTAPASQFHVKSGAVGTIAQIIQAIASQTANLTEWRTSTGALVASVGPGAAGVWGLYNTYTDASNYERLSTVATAASDFKIIPEAAGSGTLRGLQLGVSGGKLGFYGTTAVTKPAALTAADASTVDGTYGAEEAAVIANLRTRLGEVETKLQALGLLA